MSSTNYDPFAALLNNSLNYIHKPIDTTAFHPGQLIPVEIKIKNLGGVFDLRILETYPAEVKLYDPETEKWITDNPWIINMYIGPNETKTITYYALTPDKAGTYTLQTEVGYMDNETYNFYQNLSVDIVVEKDTATMTHDIISAQDIEKNIQDILKAMDSLLLITSINISNIRLMMDELLKVWEGRWREINQSFQL